MNVVINQIKEEKIDVTTSDFPGISQGLRDYLITGWKIMFTIYLPTFILQGECWRTHDKHKTIVILEKEILDKITNELKADLK
jgi:hypothetical protein